MVYRALPFLVVAALALPAIAQESSHDRVWNSLEGFTEKVIDGSPWVRPDAGHAVAVDLGQLRAVLAPAPMEGQGNDPIVIWLPRPDGTFERFAAFESPIMTPDFRAARPDVKTYAGQGVDDKAASVRFDLTPDGFHGQVLTPNGSYWIDPYTKGDITHYTSYYKKDLRRTTGWSCGVFDQEVPQAANGASGFSGRAIVSRREYRLAVAATAEYTAFFALAGDSDTQKKTRAQNAIITSMNRVNGVYEIDLAIRLNLINNTNIIYTNASTDPYSNGDGGAMLGQNQSNLTTVIGSANYDIGHVFSTGGGGVASPSCVCSSSRKAQGVTGSPAPTGDPFNIDYVAHEMGHQFGAPHSFAGTASSCSGNGSSGNAYEPGSGSTIMAYAGICGSDNLQNNSDPYFHHSSIELIRTFVTSGSGSCSTNFTTTNNTPTISTQGSFTIPANTAFSLSGVGVSDSDGDAVTVTWEQRNSAIQALPTTDPGTGSIFRPRNPTSSVSQSFPALDDVVDGTLDKGDVYPTVARTLAFRGTARDNRAGGGGVTITASQSIIITAAAGPFAVTSQNTTGITYQGLSSQTVTWNVAGTTANGVNCANVDILLSTDNGVTFPYIVASATPNDGSQIITLPNVQSSVCRFMVRGTNHIFYDICGRTFRVNQVVVPPADPTNAQASPSSFCSGQSTQLTASVGGGEVVDWYSVSCGGILVGTGNPLVINPGSSGVYFAKARRTSDNVSSTGCASVGVTVNPNPVTPTSVSTDRNNFCASDAGNIVLTATGGSGTTLRWFADSCASSTIATGNGVSIASPTATTTYFARWETSCGNSACASITVSVLNDNTAPASASVDRSQICPGDAGTILLSASGGSGTTLNWYAGSCGGGSPVASGSGVNIPAPAVTTTYYARWEGACGNSSCVSATVTVSSLADFNADGFVDGFDYDDFVACFEGVGCPPGKTADFNNDSFVDGFDYDDYISAFEGGC